MVASSPSQPFACAAIPLSYGQLAIPHLHSSQEATFDIDSPLINHYSPAASNQAGSLAPDFVVQRSPPVPTTPAPAMVDANILAQIPSSFLWTVIFIVAAVFLSLIVCAQIIATYTTAYIAAPHEVTAFLDAVDFSIQENESYDRDIARATRLEDKMRLGQLLREIQKCGDDLREDLNQIVIGENGTTLRTSARVLWAGHRRGLEERMRRLDMMRMRFMVVYMGILTSAAGEREKQALIKEKQIMLNTPPSSGAHHEHHDCARNAPHMPETPTRPAHLQALHKSITEAVTTKRPQLTRIKTHSQAMGHSDKRSQPQRLGWLGVVEELRRSPILKQRHASIEEAMRSPPMSPLGSPLLQAIPTTVPISSVLEKISDDLTLNKNNDDA
ncbi:uncharacterized protein B0I36DRAFT_365576 [Microdochium trichocladiopsis]|uniref:Uncharacterized protein n=1 Tax=Microdochium trichocladiopsis TaxID=1682393 RepID=A0A9P8Y0S6_9PEZI|nr:uncharacterized protein B0I36DRAFT_365576 [Microdochium trichocladiopsis]KAH7025936.1 hypothetical protein B0I36DRAFT_365576 [Microdochium trichocladiopsis]